MRPKKDAWRGMGKKQVVLGLAVTERGERTPI